MHSSTANQSLLLVVDSLSKEKGIDRETVFDALEQAGVRVGKTKYGHQYDIRSTVDRQTGEFRFYRHRIVVEIIDEEERPNQILLEDAVTIDPKVA
nr:transcription termination/antitermination protein NusA [Alphaproteobacteria bacterium]